MSAVGVVVVLIVAGAVAVVATKSTKPVTAHVTHRIAGTLDVPAVSQSDVSTCDLSLRQQMDMLSSGRTVPCPQGPGGGYDDVQEGAQVTVSNSSGNVLAVGRLENGIYNGGSMHVTFEFTVDDLPDAAIYQVEVAHRGALTYSKRDLTVRGWTVDLTLG